MKKHEEIYELLRAQILSGILTQGDRLPNEQALAGQFGVATMTLRRALGRLEREGLLVRRPYHGTFVALPVEGRSGDKEFRVGLVVPGDLHAVAHPVFSRLLNGIEGVLAEFGARIEFAVSNPANASSEKAFLKYIAESPVDGWIIPAKISEMARSAFKRSKASKVLLHFPDEELSGHFFENDNQSLCSQIGGHLLENGYRHAAILVVKNAINLRDEFSPLLKNVMGSVGGSVFLQEVEDWSVAAGAKACMALLAKREETDVLICDDDEVALGAMKALKERGIIPPQIGVIGAGDFPAGALVEPQLTTVALPFYQVGRDVARLLVDLILERSVEPAHRRFLPKLLIRESSLREAPFQKPKSK